MCHTTFIFGEQERLKDKNIEYSVFLIKERLCSVEVLTDQTQAAVN